MILANSKRSDFLLHHHKNKKVVHSEARLHVGKSNLYRLGVYTPINISLSSRKHKYSMSVLTHANIVSLSQNPNKLTSNSWNQSLSGGKKLNRNTTVLVILARIMMHVSVLFQLLLSLVVWLILNGIRRLIWNVLFIYVRRDIRERDLKKICINILSWVWS